MSTNTPLLSQVIENFLTARMADGYSEQTLNQYEWALSRLVKRMGDRPLSEVAVSDLRNFLIYLKVEYVPKRPNKDETRLSDVSIFHAWKAIRALYKWASKELDIPNISLRISEPKHSYSEIVPFTEEEARRLLSACGYKLVRTQGQPRQKRPTAIRDRAMILTMLDTGVRVSELCRLNVEDLNLEQGIIQIRPVGSGYKSRARVVPVGSVTSRAIWKYLAVRGETKNTEPLFVSSIGGRLDRSGVLDLCRRLGERAEVMDVHPHRFRHTFAIAYLRNKGDVFSLQRILGHTSLDMVHKYLSLAQSDVKEAHRRASPVDKWEL